MTVLTKIRAFGAAASIAMAIVLPAGAAVATSGTLHRTWRHGGQVLHHIVDPRTGTSAATPWRTATAVAVSCVQANTLTMGALVRGDGAARWLQETVDTGLRVYPAFEHDACFDRIRQAAPFTRFMASFKPIWEEYQRRLR